MSVHDRWRGARSGVGKRWEARWRAGGVQRKRRFASRQIAEAWEARQRVEPEVRLAAEGRTLTVEAMMARWLSTKAGLAPKTLDAYRAEVREVATAFGDRLASSLVPSEVRAWSGRERGLSLRRRSLVALSGAYKIAMADGLLTANPCLNVPMPRGQTTEPRFLSWAELSRLAVAAGEWAPMIWLLGTSGLRLGEAVGLQVGDVGPARVRVARSVTHTSSGVVVGSPKSKKGRDVPVPPFVLAQLPTAGRGRADWLFVGRTGVRVDANNWRRKVFTPAARAAGLGGLHPHALRHTAASLAIAAGADVLAVQRMLGHSSATTTLRIYGHLWDARLDEVADRMQEAHHAAANVVQLRAV